MDKPAKVILLRTTGVTVSLSADAAKLPRRIKVLNWGDNPNSHGKRVNVGELFVRCLAAETYPYRKVALDFEHNTFPGTAAYKESKEPRPVAGFGTIEAVEGDGVYITMSSWTPDGEKMAANYADVSAGAVTDKEGNLVAVASVALCRAGAVDGMDFVEAPLSGALGGFLKSIALGTWNEADHPRANDGKFSTSGGGGGGNDNDRPDGGFKAEKDRHTIAEEAAQTYSRIGRLERPARAREINEGLKMFRGRLRAQRSDHWNRLNEYQSVRAQHRAAIFAGLSYNRKTHSYE
ncbi:MAG: hypothetical protein IKO72_00565 [Kiritimatiellae bacterium]|nr:hypothetical protein [Kiritimatiellia bacterium]